MSTKMGTVGYEPEKEAHENLFVTGLPHTMNEITLYSLFGQYGQVKSVKALPTRSGNHSGAALVRMKSISEATWLVENLNNGIPTGLATAIMIDYARRKPSEWDPTAAEAKMGNPDMAGKVEGTDVRTLIKGLYMSGCFPGGRDGNPLSEESTVFIAGLPIDTQDDHMYLMFTPFGAVAPNGCTSVTNADGSCRGFGFCNFVEKEAADNAVKVLNGTILPDGKVLRVNIKQKRGGKGEGGKGERARSRSQERKGRDGKSKWTPGTMGRWDKEQREGERSLAGGHY